MLPPPLWLNISFLLVDLINQNQIELHCFSGLCSLYYDQVVSMMKEINLGRVLIENRRKRGITQEELAEYIGVSKAAVSKWEIGVSHN